MNFPILNNSSDALSIGHIAAPHSLQPLPLITGIQAGFPSPASDYMENRIDLNEQLIHHPAATFFMRVSGESMTGAHIMPGALLVVDRSLRPRNGSIVVAVVDGEFTVKRLQYDFARQFLVPDSANPKYRPIEIMEHTDCTIWGVVTHIILDAKTV